MLPVRGSLVAIVTPMSGGVTPDSPIDWDRFKRLIDFHVEQQTDGIVAIGTTGESAPLSEEEHCAALKQIVEMVDGRVPVVAGTGANSTIEAIALTRCETAPSAAHNRTTCNNTNSENLLPEDRVGASG